jgi:cytochrome P450
MTKTMAELPIMRFTEYDYMSGDLSTRLAQFATDHGPIFKRSIVEGPYAGIEMVYMVGPEANRFVMHTHREHFSHDRGWTPIIGETMGRGLLNMDDPEHARHRKMWNPAFAGAYMEAYLPVMQQVIAARTRKWVEQDQVDVHHEAREITFDIAAAALAGFEPGPAVDRLRQLFYTLLYGPGPSVEGTYEDYMRLAFAAQAELTNTLLQMIAARRNAPAAEGARDVLGMIARATDDDGAALSDAQVLAHVNILLVAGHETTTSLAAWVLYLLATQPAQRARVEAELDAALGDATEPIAVDAVRGLKVLDNFIRETGRLYPPVLHVPRGVVRDYEFGGYHIPAGAQVRLSLAGTHRLPQVWENPDVFDPDRLAPPREEDKRTPYALVTFGGGPRLCIGVNFANIEVKALVAHVLRHYTLAPVAGPAPVHSGFITAVLPHGIPLHVRPRA